MCQRFSVTPSSFSFFFHCVSARTDATGSCCCVNTSFFWSFTLTPRRWQPWLKARADEVNVEALVGDLCTHADPYEVGAYRYKLQSEFPTYCAVIIIRSQIKGEDRREDIRPCPCLSLQLALHLCSCSRSAADAVLAVLTRAHYWYNLCKFRDKLNEGASFQALN